MTLIEKYQAFFEKLRKMILAAQERALTAVPVQSEPVQLYSAPLVASSDLAFVVVGLYSAFCSILLLDEFSQLLHSIELGVQRVMGKHFHHGLWNSLEMFMMPFVFLGVAYIGLFQRDASAAIVLTIVLAFHVIYRKITRPRWMSEHDTMMYNKNWSFLERWWNR